MDCKYFFSTILLSLVLTPFVFAQNSIYQNHSFRPYDRYVYQSDARFHTAIKPFNLQEVSKHVAIDTLFEISTNNNVLDYVLNKDIAKFETDNFWFTINPSVDFELSKQHADTNRGWINTRGIIVDAGINNTVFLHTSFYEIQSFFRDYRYDRIKELGKTTIPGMSRGKPFGENGALDYAFADAYVSYVPSQTFSFELGHGKHFIGDGYRSLLLSDNAMNYPYFKIVTNFWNIKYMNMWSQQYFIDSPHLPNSRYPAKWNVLHYLDWSVTEWLNIGFFETIIWQNEDSLGNHRGFEFNYLNPVIFLRPVEFSIGSPDNVIMGLTGKLTLWKKHVLYGQFALDEFKFSEIKARNGWWGNKYAIQAGYKTFDIAGVKNLDIQSEVNYVRPFMYSHFTYSQQHGHANQSLAHPRGANFYESVSFLRYSYKRFFAQAKFLYLVYGKDSVGTNYGGDIFKLYSTRSAEYENKTGKSAIENTVIYKDLQLSYMINPKSNTNITVGCTHRKHSYLDAQNKQFMYYVALRSSLQNFYYDF